MDQRPGDNEEVGTLQEMGRLLTAMATPFAKDLSVDYKKAAELAVRLVDGGSDGIVVAGSTGESATLGEDEKLRLFTTVVEAVGERATVIAGTGTYSTAATVAFTRKAEATGVHGVLVVVPYYNKPPQEGLYQHFREVAEATSLPVIAYNIPGRTGVNLLPKTLLRLANDVPNLVGIKEASGSLDQIAEVLRDRAPAFLVYAGDDSFTLPVLAMGGNGVISVAGHLVGNRMKEMIEAHASGNVRLAADIHLQLTVLFRALFVTTNPIPLKWALRLVGFDAGLVRPPLCPPTEAEGEIIQNALRSLGLI